MFSVIGANNDVSGTYGGNQSGFTITAMGHTTADGKKMNMPIFFNNYSTITGDGFVGA